MGNICSDEKKNLQNATQQQQRSNPPTTINKKPQSDASEAQQLLQLQTLQDEIAKLKKEQIQMKQVIQNKQSENDKIRGQMEELKTQKQQEIDQLKNNNQKQVDPEELTKLKSQLQTLTVKLQEAIEQKEQAITEKQQIAKQLLEKDEEIKQLNIKNVLKIKQLQKLEEELGQLKHENINLKNLNLLNQNVEQDNNKIQNDFLVAKQQSEDLANLKLQLEEELNASKLEINNLNNLKMLYDINLQSIEEKDQMIENLKNENIRLDSEISILKIDLDNKGKELQEEKIMNKTKVENLEKQIASKNTAAQDKKLKQKSYTQVNSGQMQEEDNEDESDDSLNNITEIASPDRMSSQSIYQQYHEFEEKEASAEELEKAKQLYLKCTSILNSSVKEFTKHGRQTLFGRGSKRKIIFNEDFSKFCFVSTKENKQFNQVAAQKKGGTGDKVFDVTSILEIRDGMNTQNFQKIKQKKGSQENLAFSFIFKSRTVDLISMDKDENHLKEFKEALRFLQQIKKIFIFNGNEFTGTMRVYQENYLQQQQHQTAEGQTQQLQLQLIGDQDQDKTQLIQEQQQ